LPAARACASQVLQQRFGVFDLAEVAAFDLVAHHVAAGGAGAEEAGGILAADMWARLENFQRKSLSNNVTPSVMLSSTVLHDLARLLDIALRGGASAFAVSSWRSRWRSP